MVSTLGGTNLLSKKMTWSKEPPNPSSLFIDPTEMNATGTLVAIPTVYWMSKSFAYR